MNTTHSKKFDINLRFIETIITIICYICEFFKYFIPFQVLNTLAMTIGCWGISTRRGEQYYISSFWFMIMSLISVIMGKKVKFNVTPKGKQDTGNIQHILPHLIIIFLTLAGILYNGVLLAVNKHPSPSGFAANTLWCLFNVLSLSIMVRAAYWKPLKVD